MFLRSIASALPPTSHTQPEVLAALRQTSAWDSLRPRSRTLLEKVLLGESGIERRHLVRGDAAALHDATPDELTRVFEAAAPELAATAVHRALARAGVRPAELDALFLCTCTGYLCPGPTSHVAERLGLRADAVLHDVVGLGCGAAIPTLRAASHFLAAHPGANAAVVAVEVCSAAFFLNDAPDVLISLCLFGDGASASVWTGRPAPGASTWQARDFRSLHWPAEREKIRFVTEGGKLKNQLDRAVPSLAAQAVGELHAASRAAGLPPEARVLSHAGGRDVLAAVRQALPGQPLTETGHVLATCGNMSSPSVLFALEHALAADPPHHLWLTSFGAGFTAHSCALERVR